MADDTTPIKQNRCTRNGAVRTELEIVRAQPIQPEIVPFRDDGNFRDL